MTNQTNQPTNKQSGNALFLILIAVVLFAALTYAITQSNRGSGNSAAREGNTVSASSVTQFPAAMRTGITRILMRGNAVTDLNYTLPGETTTAAAEFQVFNVNGGGVTFTEPDAQSVTALAVGGSSAAATILGGRWVFKSTGSSVENIGTAADDHIAVLTNVKTGVCQQIMTQLYNVAPGTALPAGTVTEGNLLAGRAAATGLANTNPLVLTAAGGFGGRAFGCYVNGAVNFYYHVLVEQ